MQTQIIIITGLISALLTFGVFLAVKDIWKMKTASLSLRLFFAMLMFILTYMIWVSWYYGSFSSNN